MVEWYWQGKIELFGEKFLPVFVVPLQITNVLSWDVRRFSAVAGRNRTSEPWHDLAEMVELSLRISNHENTTETEGIAPYTSTFLTNAILYPK